MFCCPSHASLLYACFAAPCFIASCSAVPRSSALCFATPCFSAQSSYASWSTARFFAALALIRCFMRCWTAPCFTVSCFTGPCYAVPRTSASCFAASYLLLHPLLSLWLLLRALLLRALCLAWKHRGYGRSVSWAARSDTLVVWSASHTSVRTRLNNIVVPYDLILGCYAVWKGLQKLWTPAAPFTVRIILLRSTRKTELLRRLYNHIQSNRWYLVNCSNLIEYLYAELLFIV